MDEHITAEEYRRRFCEGNSPKRNKFNAQRTEHAGRTYDSKKEARHAAENALLERAGEIVSSIPQITIPLFPPSSDVPLSKRTYRPDFLEVLEVFPDGTFLARLVDVKGKDTPESRLKREIVKDRYKIEVQLR